MSHGEEQLVGVTKQFLISNHKLGDCAFFGCSELVIRHYLFGFDSRRHEPIVSVQIIRGLRIDEQCWVGGRRAGLNARPIHQITRYKQAIRQSRNNGIHR